MIRNKLLTIIDNYNTINVNESSNEISRAAITQIYLIWNILLLDINSLFK